MAVVTGGGRGGGNPPIISPTKKLKSFKITTFKSVYCNKAKINS